MFTKEEVVACKEMAEYAAYIGAINIKQALDFAWSESTVEFIRTKCNAQQEFWETLGNKIEECIRTMRDV